MNQYQAIDERPSVEPKWLIPLLDLGLALLAFIVAYILRYEVELIRPVLDPSQREFTPYIPFAIIYAILLYLTYQGSGLYRNVRGRALMEEIYQIGTGVATATVIVLALYFLFQPRLTSRLMLIYVAVLTILFLGLARVIQRFVLAYLRGKGIGVQNVLIIGMSDTGQAVLRVMVARPELGYKPVGYLDDNPERGAVDIGRLKGLGGLDKLEEQVKVHKVDLVVVTLKWKHYHRILELASTCQKLGIEIRIVPDIFQLNMRQVQVENLDGIPLLGVGGIDPFRGANRILKRALDIGLVIMTTPIWVPFLLICALAIRLDSQGPVFYWQNRVGENRKPFRMLKFRSMIPNAEQYREQLLAETGQNPRGGKFQNDPRITRVGSFLRRTSMDELPNLINVLRGQMSLVGPRPPIPEEVVEYEPWQLQRLQIIPGMTGLWQVSGRSDVPFDEMCLMDIYYIENWSLKLDLQILLMTVPRVILRSGAY